MPLRHRSRFLDYSCFFVTTTCNAWYHLLVTEDHFNLLYDSLAFVNRKYQASIVAYVFMPNHIHLIVYFHQENHLSAYMRDFKKYTSAYIRKMLEDSHQDRLLYKLRYHDGKRQKYKVWEDRFDDVVIRNGRILMIKFNYIHKNPVKKGLSERPEDYIHSSASYYENDTVPRIELLHVSELL